MKKILCCFVLLIQTCWGALAQAKGDHGTEIVLESCDKIIGNHLFKVFGFLPEEKLLVISKSMDEVLMTSWEMPKEGSLDLMLLPAVSGYKEGDASIKIIGEKGDQVTLEYHWKIQ